MERLIANRYPPHGWTELAQALEDPLEGELTETTNAPCGPMTSDPHAILIACKDGISVTARAWLPNPAAQSRSWSP